MGVEATVRIEFGSSGDSDAFIVFELDDELNLDDVGESKSSFEPGDTIYFKMQKDPALNVDVIVPSAGIIKDVGTITYDNSENLEFISRDSEEPTKMSLAYAPNSGSLNIEHYIEREGSVTIDRESSGVVSLTGDVNLTPFVSKVDYTYDVTSFRLVTPEKELDVDQVLPLVVVVYIDDEGGSDECNS